MDSEFHGVAKNPTGLREFPFHFMYLMVGERRIQTGSSRTDSYPFSTGESHKHSVTSKGTALFNLRFQFSHHPVKTSHVSAN